MTKFLTPYTTKKKVVQKFELPSMTDQSYKDECDLGFIIENYVKKGIPLPDSSMNYVDCTTVQEFQDAQMLVAEAKSNFEQLPSKERDRFKTVENYLEFISNPSNLKESYEKNFIDRSSVSLEDVYPERYTQPNVMDKTPVIEPGVNPTEPSQTGPGEM